MSPLCSVVQRPGHDCELTHARRRPTSMVVDELIKALEWPRRVMWPGW